MSAAHLEIQMFRHAIALSDITIRWEEKQTILSLTLMYHEDSVVWSVCVWSVMTSLQQIT